jgi:hypothetical protein
MPPVPSRLPKLRSAWAADPAWTRLAVPVAVAALELIHPPGAESADWIWIPLHLALIAAFGALVAVLWRRAHWRAARAALIAFAGANTAYLLVDGVLGDLSPGTSALANAAGAAWAAALLLMAASAPGVSRRVTAGLMMTWLAFVASAPPVGLPPLVSRLAAATTAAWIVYATGRSALPGALLTFGAVSRQHVGPEAALGMVCCALAIGLSERSTPAAASPPSAGSPR